MSDRRPAEITAARIERGRDGRPALVGTLLVEVERHPGLARVTFRIESDAHWTRRHLSRAAGVEEADGPEALVGRRVRVVLREYRDADGLAALAVHRWLRPSAEDRTTRRRVAAGEPVTDRPERRRRRDR